MHTLTTHNKRVRRKYARFALIRKNKFIPVIKSDYICTKCNSNDPPGRIKKKGGGGVACSQFAYQLFLSIWTHYPGEISPRENYKKWRKYFYTPSSFSFPSISKRFPFFFFFTLYEIYLLSNDMPRISPTILPFPTLILFAWYRIYKIPLRKEGREKVKKGERGKKYRRFF